MSSVCLVTGGAGFIGSHLVEALVQQGKPVRVLDNLATGRFENLDAVASNIEFVEGDLAEPAVARAGCAGVDTVFHLAALPSVQRSVDNPLATHHASATGTLHLLNAARISGVRRVVYAASSSVYGGLGDNQSQHEDLPPNPQSPYAAAKLAGEYYARAFAASYGLETVCLRLFNVFGPRQCADSAYAGAIPRFCSMMLKNKAPVIHGDGRQSRDFTFVENAVFGFLRASVTPAVSGTIYNIGTGQSVDLLEIVAILNRLMGTRISPRHAAARPGDVHSSRADIRRATHDLGYQPTIPFEEGLERTITWYRAQPKT
jgi:UDP-glucose 4-epimerase